MKTKSFDCVAMMHKGARRIYAATKSMSRKVELAYWQSREKDLLPAAQAAARPADVVRETRAAYRVVR